MLYEIDENKQNKKKKKCKKFQTNWPKTSSVLNDQCAFSALNPNDNCPVGEFYFPIFSTLRI